MMTVIDLAAIALAALAVACVFRGRRREFDAGILLTLTGFLVWVLFFLADLAIMHGSHLVSDRPMQQIMADLHRNYYWYGGIAGVALVSVGLVLTHSRHQATASRLENFIELIDHLAEPCMIVSQWKIAAINPALERTIFKSRELLLGRDPYEVWDMLEFELPSREEIVAHLTEKSSWSFISKLIRSDGTTGHSEIRLSLLDATRAEVVIFITDITERIEAQRRLKESEMRMATAQQIAGMGYWHYRMSDGHIEWSNELLGIFGLDDPGHQAEYPTSSSLWDLVHPDDVDFLRDYIEQAIESGIEPPEVTFKVIRPDEELRHLRARFGLVRDAEDTVEELYAVVLDVTDTVRTDERLRHAQKMEAVGELTGGVSHDFNNLLQVILGNTELIEHDVSGEVAESVQTIRRAAERGSELTRLLLAFSRRQVLEPRTVDVNVCIQDIVPLLARTLGETIRVETRPDEGLKYSNIDPGQLESCILNLAINAQHAMPDGGTLTIETRNRVLDEAFTATRDEVEPGDYVQVSITDTGVGMPAAIQARAFEPFFTTKEVGKGSGLGLSMVYGFIKQSNGHVELSSSPGAGTTVTLYLPIADHVERMETQAVAPQATTRFAGKVLLVEDDPHVAVLARRFLESFGLEVIMVHEATGARQAIADHDDIDLLLTDVVLPGGVNGPGIAEEARRQYPDLKVLFMSGYTDDAITGGEDVMLLRKPFRKTDLAEKLDQVLG